MKKFAIGSIAALGTFSALVLADVVTQDNAIIIGNLCAGLDCTAGEPFSHDTLTLKENSISIDFIDTSDTASFPSNDWKIQINHPDNGGPNRFAIHDVDAATMPFNIEAGATSHSLYIDDVGRVGLGTSTPSAEAHVLNNDTTVLRLEQDGSAGWDPQTWDVAGNETNFFIRDVTNGHTLPFSIRSNAPNNSLVIGEDTGYIGLGDIYPDSPLHIINSDDALGTMITVERNNITTGSIQGMKFINNGGTILTFENTNPGFGLPSEWDFQVRHDDGSITFANSASTGDKLKLSHNGNLTIAGDIVANGTTYTSSRLAKENFASVNVSNVLAAVAKLTISKWNYIKNDDDIKHIGPMAEDFHKAFGLNGSKDDRISVADVNGITLASIQALKIESDKKDREIATLKDEISELKAMVNKLVKR